MTLFHDLQGQGDPALVFIHGLGCDHTDWKGQVAHFKARHRCISMDLPGHGRSPSHGRPLGIERFIDEVSGLLDSRLAADERAVVFGHSMGCRVAVGVAQRLAQRAAGVVLVDGSHFGEGDPEAIRNAWLRKVADAGFQQSMETIFAAMFTAASPPDLVARAMTRAAAMEPALTPGLLADMAAWDAASTERAIRALEPPLMAIQSTSVDTGRKRVVIAPGEGSDFTDHLLQWLPDPRIEIIPGVGHFTMVEALDEVNARIEDFVRRL